jgi:hypothetical protein
MLHEILEILTTLDRQVRYRKIESLLESQGFEIYVKFEVAYKTRYRVDLYRHSPCPIGRGYHESLSLAMLAAYADAIEIIEMLNLPQQQEAA